MWSDFSETSLLNWLNTFVVCSIFCRCFVWAILLAVIGFVWHFGCCYSILSTFGKNKACLISYELLTQRVNSGQFKLYQHVYGRVFLKFLSLQQEELKRLHDSELIYSESDRSECLQQDQLHSLLESSLDDTPSHTKAWKIAICVLGYKCHRFEENIAQPFFPKPQHFLNLTH